MLNMCSRNLVLACLAGFAPSLVFAQANNAPDLSSSVPNASTAAIAADESAERTPAAAEEQAMRLRKVNAEWRRQREELNAKKTREWREAQEEWKRQLAEINAMDIPAAERARRRAEISEEKDQKLKAHRVSYAEEMALINETREQDRAMVIAAQGNMLVDLGIGAEPPSDAAAPTATNQTPVSGTTAPDGPTQTAIPPVDLSQALPPTESLGDEILRNNVSADEMRRREQLFAAAQNQRRRADAGSGAVDPDGFLGQNDPRYLVFDCDDTNRHVNPSATEICNYIDDDCDGDADIDPATGEPLYQMLFLDRDGDRHGDPGAQAGVCPQTTRDTESGAYMVTHGNDCDDLDPDRWSSCDAQ